VEATIKKHMKALSMMLLAAWIYPASWCAQRVRADDNKFAQGSASPTATQGPLQDPAGPPSTTTVSVSHAADSVSVPEDGNAASGLFRRWLRMGERIQAQEPDWLSPLVTTSGRLKNEFRYDVFHQPLSPGGSQYNFGGGKGLEFIVAPHVQLLLGPPPYVAHMGSATPDGYADIPLMIKVQLMAAGPSEGNYLLTVLMSATVPAGSNSMRNSVLSPTITFGKGWGNFDMQSTFGENLPAGDTAAVGRQLVENTAFQYRVFGKLWPEVEVNSEFFMTGKAAGETQVFLTPGLGVGRVRVWRALKFSTAAGMQIAATRFHTYNHRAIVSVRCSF
jgi:hypothetical protein